MSGDLSSMMAGKALIINDEEVRMVMLGKTGAGKSATGNTILGHKAFETKFAGTSLTKNCLKVRGVVAFSNVSVIDTPGFFDTELTTDENLEVIKLCISLSAPGPHVFLIVTKLGRFTQEEQKSVQIVEEMFGEMSNKYTMILFTGGDQLEDESVEELVRNTPKLQEFIGKCEGRYHVFNNKAKYPSQVSELLKKINSMVLKNGGSHYTNEMFQKAEKAIEEEKQRILKENEEKRCEEEEKLKKTLRGDALKEAIQSLKEEYELEARTTAEKTNKFMNCGLVASGAGVGFTAGLVFGPAGALVGTVVGGLLGVVAVTVKEEKKCIIQ